MSLIKKNNPTSSLRLLGIGERGGGEGWWRDFYLTLSALEPPCRLPNKRSRSNGNPTTEKTKTSTLTNKHKQKYNNSKSNKQTKSKLANNSTKLQLETTMS